MSRRGCNVGDAEPSTGGEGYQSETKVAPSQLKKRKPEQECEIKRREGGQKKSNLASREKRKKGVRIRKQKGKARPR